MAKISMDQQIDVEDENVNQEVKKMEEMNNVMPSSDELLKMNKIHHRKNFIRLN